MANASAKRTAQQNAETIKNMNLGMLLTGALSLLLRVFLRKGTLSPTRLSFWLLVLSYVPSIFLSRYLERIGSPKRDPTTGTLISSGEDLGRPGVIEYAFDVIYITWACQVGSGIFGDWFWFFYLVIPLYAGYKLWTVAISPLLLGRSSGAGVQEDAAPKEASSKRQEKLRKRAERGDPRVRMQNTRS
ncbi:putative opsin [Rhodofomes roseus]|uniref:Opsin n=1 Tax=Rhodofomes roseus TaxID=34475 RepID=A0ABQ8KXN3_9APHY|nr:putative opsin [Rhodofomes roseus]KAH9844001.1 putative opsin [Rhodofomes roseus]